MPLPEELQARAGSFGIDAEAYERHRPSYPPLVVDVLLAGDTHAVVDVGCGTGKLGRLLAERGADVLGVEPDERMAEVARRHGLPVEVSPFETWEPAGRSFDLVTSGQAWHWVDQELGARRAAEVLRPGGRLAIVWNIGRHDDHAQAALDVVYAEHMPENVSTGSLGRIGGEKWHLSGVDDTGEFGEQQVWSTDWQQVHTSADWLLHLDTMSDHRLLPVAQKAALYAGIREVVDDQLGGTLTLHYDTRVISAVRR